MDGGGVFRKKKQKFPFLGINSSDPTSPSRVSLISDRILLTNVRFVKRLASSMTRFAFPTTTARGSPDLVGLLSVGVSVGWCTLPILGLAIGVSVDSILELQHYPLIGPVEASVFRSLSYNLCIIP